MFVKHMAHTFCGAPIVTCCVYHLWLIMFTANLSLGTVLIGMKLEVCCTSVASVVSLFIGIKKKTVCDCD